MSIPAALIAQGSGAGGSSNCVPVPVGLVSWWRAENSTADAVGGKNGTIAGTGTVTYGPGVVGQAFVFDGTHRDRIDLGNPTNLQLQDFTLEAWIKRSSPTVTAFDILGADGSVCGDGACIIGYGRGGYILAVANDGRLILSRTDIDGVISTQLITDTNWHHLAVTKAGSNAVFYVDGLPQATPPYAPHEPYTFDDATCSCTAAIAIGSRGDARGGTFFGMIDEPAVFNRALSAGEIQSIYAAGSAGMCPPAPPVCVPAPAGLVSWWRAEGNANDAVGANNGVITGNVSFVAGEVGQAFECDGATSAITVPASSNLALQSLTIEAWINPTDVSIERPIVEYAAPTGPLSIQFWYSEAAAPGGGYTAPGALYGLFRDPGGAALQVSTAAGLIPSNQWTHVAMTFDYGTRTATLYVNGVSQAANTSGVPINANTFVNVNLGYRPDGSSELLAGRRHVGGLDEVSIYNRALGGSEIQAIYLAGSAGKCVPPPPVGCVPAPTNLVSWWRAEGNAKDAAGPNDGALVGGTTFAPAIVGEGFSFNGSGADVQVPDSPSLRLTNELTLELWYKDTGCPAGNFAYGLIAKRAPYPTGANFGINMYLGTPSGLQVYLQDPNYPSYPLASCPVPVAGVFHHLAATYRQVTSEQVEIKIYVDGQLVQTQDITGNLGRTLNGAAVTIGSSNPSEEFFVGIIDEPSIYSRALTATEIQAIYNAGAAGKCVPPPPVGCVPAPTNLVSWWRGESNALDQVGGNNGTLVGAVSFGPGRVGSGFVFENGTDYTDYVSVGAGSNLFLQNFTIETWMRRASSSVVGYGYAGAGFLFGFGVGGYGVYLEADGTPALIRVGIDQATASVAITDTNFHHLAVSKSGSQVIFYIDGVAYPAPAYNATFTFSPGAVIGNVASSLNTGFFGVIDELSIYSRPLSAAEVQAIYSAGSAGKCAIPIAPSITSQPTSQTVTVGDTATFSVSASGTAPLSYQWTLGGMALVGATGPTLTLTNVQMSQAGTYAVVVTNVAGSVTSSNATLTVNPQPPCVVAPTNLVSWWRGEGNALDQVGGNNGTLVGAVSFGPGRVGGYGVYLEADGTPALIRVGIDQATASVAITDTNFHHLAVSKSGSQVIFYIDGVAYPAPAYNGTFTFSPGAVIGNVASSLNTGFFGVIDELSIYSRPLSAAEVQAIYGAGKSGKCVGAVLPSITTQPTNQTVYVGGSTTFTVGAAGTAPLSYQWLFNGIGLAGQTSTAFTLSNVQSTNGGNYSVIVSNGTGSVTSSNALLTVLTLPQSNCVPAPSGLVSWWRAERNASDAVGGNNGAITGNVSFVAGKVGQAFECDGATSAITVPASSNLALQSLTIEAWINPTDVSIERPIVEYAAPTGPLSIQFWYSEAAAPGGGYTAPGALYGLFRDPGGAALQVSTAAGLIPSNQWTHVAMTFDYGTRTATLYVNGVSQAANTSGVPINANTFVNVNLGYRPDGSSELLAGRRHVGGLDEVSIYNHALGASEIQAIYLAGSAGKCVPPVGCVPAPTNLVSWWRAEGNAKDAAGPNNGTLINGAGFAPGQVGEAFSFNGTNQDVVVPDSPSLRLTNELTLELWYKDTGCPPGPRAYGFIAKRAPYPTGANFGMNMYLGTPSAIQVYLQDPNYPSYPLATAPVPAAGVFHHLAATYRQATAEQVEIRIYIDGQLATIQNISGNLGRTLNAAPVTIGSSNPSEEFFVGEIDEPSIYNRALTAAEIQAIYNAGSAGKCPPPPPVACVPAPTNLVSWWRAEDNAKDAAGPNDGTLMNGAGFAPGQVGEAFSFNGTNQDVVVPDSPSLRLTNELTLELWYKDTGCPPGPRAYGFIAKRAPYPTGANFGMNMYLGTPSAIQVYLQDPNYPSYPLATAPVPAAGVFHHLAATYRQATAEQVEIRIYIDGQLATTQNITGNLGRTLNGAAVTIGSSNPSEEFFVGIIDEPSIYSRALTATEIQAIYNAGAAGKCVPRRVRAANLLAQTGQNQPMSIPAQKFVLISSDPNNNPLGLGAVSPASANGATVVMGADAVTYSPASNFIGADSFSFTVTNGQGGAASAYVLVQVTPTNQVSANMLPPTAARGGGFTVSFAGVQGRTYSLQRAPTAAGPWVTITSVTVGANGMGTFVDANPPPGSAFYRTTYP